MSRDPNSQIIWKLYAIMGIFNAIIYALLIEIIRENYVMHLQSILRFRNTIHNLNALHTTTSTIFFITPVRAHYKHYPSHVFVPQSQL